MEPLKTITVFTPTYNRAYCLPDLYNSLIKQTLHDFIWLIIDDGSEDNTRELVHSWIKEKRIEIQYHYKENGGMHTGHNAAYERIKTPLNVCIDSDDYMPEDAVESIVTFWKKNKAEHYAGIIGLDIYKDGSIVSNKSFPEGVRAGKYSELKTKYKIWGDTKFVYRTDVINKYPKYPEFPDEKFVPLNYKYLLIDQDYEMLFLNKPLCVVEYLPDGSSKNIITQYKKNPKGFLHERKVRMKYSPTLKEKYRHAIHYVSSCIMTRNIRLFKDSTNKPLTFLALLPGILLFLYVRNTNKTALNPMLNKSRSGNQNTEPANS